MKSIWYTGLACCAAFAPTTAFAATKVPVPAHQCFVDLRTFDAMQQKDGYWMEGYGYTYGIRYGQSDHYLRTRPGYEVRTVLASARILAQNGQQAPCETVLAVAREMYAAYVAELRNGQLPPVDISTWRRTQIETAVPVTAGKRVYRSDELIGASIINGSNDSLGSVEDIIVSPQTGKIAYLIVSHGGLWSMDQTYTPVPWSDFKSAVRSNLLILPVPKTTLDDAPHYGADTVGRPGPFATRSRAVAAYWTAHPPVAMN